MSHLLTPLDLANRLRIPGKDDRARERRVLELKNRNGWPSVKIGLLVRFTADQADEIVERHTVAPGGGLAAAAPAEPVAIPGQTQKSAART